MSKLKVSFDTSNSKASEGSPLLENSGSKGYVPPQNESALWGKKSLMGIVFIIVTTLILYKFTNVISTPQYQTIYIYNYSTSYNGSRGWYELSDSTKVNNSDACGSYYPNANNNGWNYLDIETNPRDDSKDAYLDSMRAMGFIEGYSTHTEITAYYTNFFEGMFGTVTPPPCVSGFLSDNFIWIESEAERKYIKDEYWFVMKGVLHQLKGLYDGYRMAILNTKLSVTNNHPNYCLDHWEECMTTALDCRNGECPTMVDAEHLNGKILTDISDPSILHLLILNGNGDLYQILQKCAELETSPNPFHVLESAYMGKKGEEDPSDGKNGENGNGSDSAYDDDDNIHNGRSHGHEDSGNNKKDDENNKYGDHSKKEHMKRVLERGQTKERHISTHDLYGDVSTPDLHNNVHRVLHEQELHVQDEKELLKDNAFITTPFHRIDHCSAFIKLFMAVDDKETGGGDRSDHVGGDVRKLLDVAVGHNTWDDLRNAGPRIFKHYTFRNRVEQKQDELNSVSVITHPEVYFSSSPGLLTSVDDFYTVFSRGTYSDNLYQNEVYKYPERGRFAVVETSLDVYNVEALALIEPNSLLSWCRVRAANLMAIDGDDWSKIFSYEHSGTYSNQWMIIDFSKLYDFPVIGAQQPTISGNTGESASWIGPGLLTVLEEMPGLIQYEDMTSKLLEKGYWASYNIPYFPGTSNYSGTTAACEAQKETVRDFEKSLLSLSNDNNTNFDRDFNVRLATPDCHDLCTRARLFDRIAVEVNSIQDMRWIMGYNHWEEDVESADDSCESIACRQDLEPNITQRRVFGALDAKVTSIRSADIYRDIFLGGNNVVSGQRRPAIYARQGPTTDTQPPFCWKRFESEKENLIVLNRHRHLGVQGAQSVVEAEGSWSGDAERYLRRMAYGYEEENYEGGAREEEEDQQMMIPPFWRRRRVREGSFSHMGQPDCYNYTWQVFPLTESEHYVPLP